MIVSHRFITHTFDPRVYRLLYLFRRDVVDAVPSIQTIQILYFPPVIDLFVFSSVTLAYIASSL